MPTPTVTALMVCQLWLFATVASAPVGHSITLHVKEGKVEQENLLGRIFHWPSRSQVSISVSALMGWVIFVFIIAPVVLKLLGARK